MKYIINVNKRNTPGNNQKRLKVNRYRKQNIYIYTVFIYTFIIIYGIWELFSSIIIEIDSISII